MMTEVSSLEKITHRLFIPASYKRHVGAHTTLMNKIRQNQELREGTDLQPLILDPDAISRDLLPRSWT